MIRMLIGEHRIKQGLSLKQLEEMTGISSTSINDYENNKVSVPLEKAVLIAQALNLNITDLYRVE